MQACGGGTWGGCIYDVDALIATLAAGRRAAGLMTVCAVLSKWQQRTSARGSFCRSGMFEPHRLAWQYDLSQIPAMTLVLAAILGAPLAYSTAPSARDAHKWQIPQGSAAASGCGNESNRFGL